MGPNEVLRLLVEPLRPSISRALYALHTLALQWQANPINGEPKKIDIAQLVKMSLIPFFGMIAITIVYLLYRRKLIRDQRDLESLKSDQMRLRVEALAAERKARREKMEQARRLSNEKRNALKGSKSSDDGSVEGESLV